MNKKFTIKEALLASAKKLKDKKIASALLDAEILLAQALGKNKEFLYTEPNLKLTTKQLATYNSFMKRRLKNEPVAYIVGSKEFYGLKFKVDKNVLIPRPETELMIDETLKLITCNQPRTGANTIRGKQPTTVIDVGTGSGCVIVSIAKKITEQSKLQNSLLRHSCENRNPKNETPPGSRIPPALKLRRAGKSGMTIVKFFGIDNSKKALKIAKQNARIHGVGQKIKFLKGDLLNLKIGNWKLLASQNLPTGRVGGEIGNLVIAANLPYLTMRQYKNNKDLYFEPKMALVGGSDGLEYIKLLLQQINKLLASSCKLSVLVFIEIDPTQTGKIKKLIKFYFPQNTFQIKKDLSGLDRLAIIDLKN